MTTNPHPVEYCKDPLKQKNKHSISLQNYQKKLTLSWNPIVYAFFALLGVIPAIVFTPLLATLVPLGVVWVPFHLVVPVMGFLYVIYVSLKLHHGSIPRVILYDGFNWGAPGFPTHLHKHLLAAICMVFWMSLSFAPFNISIIGRGTFRVYYELFVPLFWRVFFGLSLWLSKTSGPRIPIN